MHFNPKNLAIVNISGFTMGRIYLAIHDFSVEYSTSLKSLLNTFWFFDSCLLLIFSSLDMIEQENIIKRFLAIVSGFTCH